MVPLRLRRHIRNLNRQTRVHRVLGLFSNGFKVSGFYPQGQLFL